MEDKLNETEKIKIRFLVDKVIKEYGCALVALGREDKSIIEECEKTGHKKYHFQPIT